MFDTLSKAGKYLGRAAKMMIGVPDYDNYVEHMRITHPDQTPMTYEEFFRERRGRALRRQGRGEVLLTLFRQIEADLLLGYSRKSPPVFRGCASADGSPALPAVTPRTG